VLTILGATGYTGRLCAAEAARQGVPMALAGRRRPALTALAEQVGGAAVHVADTDDPAPLLALCEASDVVLTCVGPYAVRGRAVVAACLATSTPYLDISGEVGFLESVHACDPQARAAGCALVPGAGFDGVPGEALAAIAVECLTGAPDQVRVAYAVTGGAPSAGTVRSVIGVAAEGGAVWRGRLVHEPALADAWQAPWPSASFGAASVPLPEVVSVGRSTGGVVVRSYVAVPGAARLAAVAGPLDMVATAALRTPLRGLAERLANRLPAGPPARRRAATRSRVVVEARRRGESAVAAATVDDPYLATARVSVALAAALAAADPAPVGVLTPVEAARALGHDPRWLLSSLGATLVA